MVERLRSLLQMISSNPRLEENIRSLVVNGIREVPESIDEVLYQVVLRLQNITKLTIIFYHDSWFRGRPLLGNAISLLLQGAHLQHLSFSSCPTFKTSSIATCSTLKSIAFDSTRGVVVDHTEEPCPLPFFHKLKITYSVIILETMRSDPRLRALFGNVQDLDISFNFERPPPWKDTLDWTNFQSLSLTTTLICEHSFRDFTIVRTHTYLRLGSLDERFGSFFEEMPWTSFSRLGALSLTVDFAIPSYQRTTPTSWFTSPSIPQIFSGASHLVQLRSLAVTYHFLTPFVDEPWIDQTMRELCGQCLDPTFKVREAFPALKSFSTSISMVISSVISYRLDKAGLSARTIAHLPSVFGPGGRVEVDGWKAVVDGDLSISYVEYDSGVDDDEDDEEEEDDYGQTLDQ